MSTIPEPTASASEQPAAPPVPPSAGTTTLTQPPTVQSPSRDERRDGRGRGGWALLVRLHFYAGILVAPFLAVAALTGLAYAFTPQLDQLVYADQLTVTNATGTPRSLAEQIQAAHTAQPEGTLAKVITPDAPDATTRVVFNVQGLGENQRTVYVDPYTGQAKGVLTTWFDSTPLTTWIDELHRSLHLGATGRLYSELAASWLWVVTGGGLLMWLGRRRHYRGNKPARSALVPDRSARGLRRTRSLHASVGAWLILGFLFLSATGLTWSDHAGANFQAFLDTVRGSAPELNTSLTAAPSGNGGHGGHQTGGHQAGSVNPSDADRVLAAARNAGLSGPVEVAPPEEPGHAWSVAQVDNRWPVRKDKVAVDPATGHITARVDWADHPALAKLSSLGIQAHMGALFGIINQIVLAAIAVGLLTILTLGYRMWWQRRPTRTQRWGFGKPPTRGTWRNLPRPRLALLVLAAIAVGWALPLLGITLLVFLVLDAGFYLFHRRRTDTTPTRS